MTSETGIDADRDTLALMAAIAAFRIGRMQDILDHRLAVAAMGAVTGGAVLYFRRKVGVLLLHRLGRMAALADFIRIPDEQIAVVRLMRIMAGSTLALGIRRMGIFELLGQVGMAVEAEPRTTCIEQLV